MTDPACDPLSSVNNSILLPAPGWVVEDTDAPSCVDAVSSPAVGGKLGKPFPWFRSALVAMFVTATLAAPCLMSVRASPDAPVTMGMGSAVFPGNAAGPAPGAVADKDYYYASRSATMLSVVKDMGAMRPSKVRDDIGKAEPLFTDEALKAFVLQVSGSKHIFPAGDLDIGTVSVQPYGKPVWVTADRMLLAVMVIRFAEGGTEVMQGNLRAAFLPTHRVGRPPLVSSMTLDID